MSKGKRRGKLGARDVPLTVSFSDIAALLDGDSLRIEIPGKSDVVVLKVRRYRSDPKGVDEVRDSLEDNFDDDDLDDDDDDEDVEDPEDYIDEDEDEDEGEDEELEDPEGLT